MPYNSFGNVPPDYPNIRRIRTTPHKINITEGKSQTTPHSVGKNSEDDMFVETVIPENIVKEENKAKEKDMDDNLHTNDKVDEIVIPFDEEFDLSDMDDNEQELQSHQEETEEVVIEESFVEEQPEEDKPSYEELLLGYELVQKENETLTFRYENLQKDWTNYKRRVEENKEQEKMEACVSIAKSMFSILDDLERALAHAKEFGDGGSGLIAGNEAIYKRILGVLEKNGIKQIAPLGEKFDVNLHQAIELVSDSDAESDTVVKVHQNGYVLGDKVLRSAIVSVSS